MAVFPNSQSKCSQEICCTAHCFMDSQGSGWCMNHLCLAVGHAEASVTRDPLHAGRFDHDGPCVVHGADCPKPWAPLAEEKS